MFNKALMFIKDKKIEVLECEINSLRNALKTTCDKLMITKDDHILDVKNFNVSAGSTKVELENKIINLEHEINQFEIEKSRIVNDFKVQLAEKENEINLMEVNNSAEIQEAKDETEKAVRKELKVEIESSKKEADKVTKELFDFKGRYDGSLLVIKNLEKQVESLTKLNNNLLSNLPELKANLSSQPANVTVNK